MTNQTVIKSGCYSFEFPLHLEAEEKWKPHPIFHGSTTALKDLSCHVSTLVYDFSPHPPHEHKEEEILIVLSGEVDIILKDYTVPAQTCFYRKRLQKNQFAYYPANFAHSLETTSKEPATYLMFRWCGSSFPKNNMLNFCSFDSLPIRHEANNRQAVSPQFIFEEPTRYLEMLHCHTTRLAPGAGYSPHADSYDVAILLLEGEVQTIGQNIKAPGVIFYETGKPHGILNPTGYTAKYLVFEFHRHSLKLLQKTSSLKKNKNIKPSLIILDASSACQLRCPSCPTGQGMTLKTLGAKFLKFIDFKNLIDANPWISAIELSNWGEIFLNPEIISIIEYGFKKNIALQAYNGVNLNTVSNDILEALVKYQFQGMTVSLDGASNDTYKIYRVGGDFEKVIAHIRIINAFKQRYQTHLPKMVWQFVAFGHNEHEIAKARNMAVELKMDFYVKISFGDLYTGEIFSPIKNRELIRRESGVDCADRQEYLKKHGERYLQKASCAQLWKSPHIHADGRLLGCCTNYKQDYGNVFEEGLLECINNEKINYARQMLMGQEPPREDIPCSKCFYYQTMHTNMEHKSISTTRADAKQYPREYNKKEKALSVAFFSHSSGLAGAERSLVDLVEDLCNDSVSCSVLLPSDGPLKDVLLDKGAAVYVLPNSDCWWVDNKNIFSKENQKPRLARAMMVMVTGALPVLRHLRPDVIYTQTIVAPWGALCAEILSIPHVLSVCEYGELDHQFKFYFGFQESVKALYDSSQAIFSVTKSVKNVVFKGISDKDKKIEIVYRSVRLVPNNDIDVKPQDYNYKNKSEIKMAIFGTIHEGKGQEDIVRAGIELMKRGRKVKIYIFGYSDPQYSAFIKDLIDVSVYRENFIIKDFVNDPIKHMKEMDIIVSCSRNEALGRTLFEAILLDKPIVYSDSGGPKEIFTDEEHGLAYKCADEHSLVEKLLFVMDHPDKTKQRVKTAKEYVLKNFSPENYSGKIESRLKQLKGKKIETSHSVQVLFGFDFLVDAMRIEFERKDAEISTMRNELAERDAQIAEFKEDNYPRGEWALGLDRQLKEARAKIVQITSSNSWKITRPLREFRRWLTHPSSQARRYLQIIAGWSRELYARLPLSHQTKTAHRLILAKYFPGVLRLTNSSRTAPAGLSVSHVTDWSIAYPIADMTAFASNLEIKTSSQPVVSVIIPVYGHCDYTLRCLALIADYPPASPFEVIIVDDCSSDGSVEVLRRMQNIRLIDNSENKGFIHSCNIGAGAACGRYLYFLNNDIVVTPGWLDELVRTFHEFPGTGLVGSKLLYPDGSLQEAGCIIWRDGSACNFGRRHDASLPVYNYAREVDYCSGASIMVPKTLFDKLGGFDEHYLPAYCEDADLALKIRDRGYRVIYQPLSMVFHFEGITSGTDTNRGVKAHQVENTKKLFHRWQQRLKTYQINGKDVDAAKDRRATRRVLLLDHCTPTPNQDSGSIDAYNIMLLLREMDFQVTFIPEDNFLYMPGYTTALQRSGIEMLYAPYVINVEQHLKDYGERYDLVFMFRFDVVERHIKGVRKYCKKAKVILNMVDLHYLRLEREAKLLNDDEKMQTAREIKNAEYAAIRAVDVATVISEEELKLLKSDLPAANLCLMPFSRHIIGTRNGFADRRDIVFIGGYQHLPNVDAVKYFVSNVLPHLRKLLPGVRFYVVGSKPPAEFQLLAAEDVIVTGFVENLNPLLDRMRISVAPLRYGAGIKGKIGTALAAGLPVVATSLAAEGMSLTDGETILIADDPEFFAQTVSRLYNDETLWCQLSRAGIAFAERAWGIDAGWNTLASIMRNAGFTIAQRRYPLKLYTEYRKEDQKKEAEENDIAEG